MKSIFFFPYETNGDYDRPSRQRPAKMLDAFKNSTRIEEVIEITGIQRYKGVNKCYLDIRDNKISFVYVESINKPLLIQRLLEGKLNILKDYFFLWKCKKNKIPLTIFYRDARWVTPRFKKIVPFYAVYPLKALFYLEFKLFEYLFDVLFLPSQEMAKSLPLGIDHILIDELFPAVDMKEYKYIEQTRAPGESLVLLYVGNINPDYYDITPIIKLLKNNRRVELNLCCRKEDWEENNKYYDIKGIKNITIHHLEYHELESIYNESDIHIMLYNVDSYREIAVPFKFYESLQFTTPVITNSGTKVASLVHEMEVGWVVDQLEDVNQLLFQIAKDDSLLAEKKNKINRAIINNTWDSRVEKVITVCSEIRKGKSN